MKKIWTVLLGFTLLTLVGCDKAAVVPETGTSAYFTDVILPFIIQYGTTAIGVLSVLVPILSKINRSRKTFDSAGEALKEAREENKRLRAELADHEKATSDKLLTYEAEIAAVRDDLPALKNLLEKLLSIERLAYLNSPALVSDGTARKIAEVCDEAQNEG